MVERSRIFDDLAGVAGGAFSALAGLGDELAALVRSRVDEALAALAVVRRDELDAVAELAANARAAGEDAEARLLAVERRLAALEKRFARDAEGAAGAPDSALAAHDHQSGHGAPGGPPAAAAGETAATPGGAPKAASGADSSELPPPAA